MTGFIAVLISGLSFGLLYAVMGVGLVLIYRGSRVVNFSYGASIGLLAYILAELVKRLHNTAAAIILTALIAVGLGYVLRYAVVGAQDHVTKQPLRLRGLFDADTLLRMVVATIGIGLLIEGIEEISWGTSSFALPVSLGSSTHDIHGVHIADSTIAIIVLSCLILLAISFILYRTPIGFQIRAVFDNAMAANLLGMSVALCFTVVWIMASLVGLAAAIMASSSIYISTTSYVSFAFVSFIAVVLGGLDSIRGAVVGGLVVGIANAMIGAYWTSNANELLLLGLAIILLWVRPQGLFSSGTEASARL